MTKFTLTLTALAAAPLAIAQPAGFQLNVFAAPPNIEYPTCVIAGANGDVYVSSDKNGSLGHTPDFGRVIRCTDTDGDGKADKFVDFVPKINSPRGGHFVGDTLYIIHPPFLSSYRDTNGDGVAEEHKVLVTGLGGGIEHPRGADHTTNGVRMGIDGWLYISVGDFGTFPAKGTDGSTYTLYGGGVIRVRPDGSRVEPYALMVRNICDTAISPTLDMFSRDNTNDGKGWNTRFHHYTALGDHGYPRLYQNFKDEAIVPLADYGGGSGTGALWLSEPGFPPEFTDALFSTDWTTGTVHYHPWKRVGASFEVEQKTFAKVPRAIDVDVDGFSRLYIADWRGGGYNFSGPGKPVGMIQRAVFPGATAAKYQDVTKANDTDLAALVGSASAVQRLEASRELIKRGGKPAIAKVLMAVAKDSGKSVGARTAAIFTFTQMYGKFGAKYVAELAADATVREAALRAMADIPDAKLPEDLYVKYLKDPDQRVVLQAIVGLQRMGAKDSAKAILDASKSWKEVGVSPRLRHTAMQALAILGNVPPMLEAAKNKETSELALLALMRVHTNECVDGLIALVPTQDDPDIRIGVLEALARLYHKEKPWDMKSWWNTRPDDRGPYYEPITWEATDRIGPAIEQGYAKVSAARQKEMLDLLTKNRLPVNQLKLAVSDPFVTALNNKTPDAAALAVLAKGAMESSREMAQRIKAYRILLDVPAKDTLALRVGVLAAWVAEGPKAPGHQPLVLDFINSPERAKEIVGLREIAAKPDNDTASSIAWQGLLTLMRSPLSSAETKAEVKKLVDANPLEPGFFNALKELGMSGFDTQIVAGQASGKHEVVAAAQAAATVPKAVVPAKKVGTMPVAEATKAALEGKGDVKRGEWLYLAQGCISCHSVDKAGEQKGPYLGDAGAKFSREYLVESVIDPNKVVAQGFPSSLMMLKDGSSTMGFISKEEDGVVELRDVAGKLTQVKRADVSQETHLPNSMMPPGLASELSVEDWVSLMEYIVSLKQPGG
ncbi:MAG: c-type cytochrome [Verrucomicrobiota bacterium]